MKREIYIVNAMIVDANGTYNNLSGYPKAFDSKNYSNNINTTLLRAKAEYHETIGTLCKREDRQLQTVTLMDAYGEEKEPAFSIGAIVDVPDPE